MIITLDGPAGTGKSTAAKRLAEAIGFTYFDTGALYRAISWKILQDHVEYQDKGALGDLLHSFSFKIQIIEGEKHYFVGKEDVTKAIRSKEVTAIVSEVSALQEVREALKPLQVDFAKGIDVVFEGRDLGTVVFPKAELKFYLTARPDIRARRRLKELEERFPDQTFHYETILSEIEQRDQLDSSRAFAPLRQADDAVLVDTSDLGIDQVVDRLEQLYTQRIKK